MTEPPTAETAPHGVTPGTAASNALSYWEPRRLVYNGVLLLVVAGCFVAGMPEARSHVGPNLLIVLFLLAVVANVLYSLAYLVDVFVQISSLRAAWLQRRWVLFAVGTLAAAALARFAAIGFFAGWRGN